MKFAVVDHRDEIIVTFDSGREMTRRIMDLLVQEEPFIGLRPGRRKRLEEQVETALAAVVKELGLEVGRL